MAEYQAGSQVGAVVGASTPGGVKEALSPDTPSGQAAVLALVGLVILFLTVGRREGGFVGRLGAVASSILVIGSAMLVVNWLGRTYALTHDDGPLADGIRLDL